jgi:nitroreductase
MNNPVVLLLEKRHATRSISPEPLPPSTLEALQQAARLTPSCFNKQPWRFLFLTSEAARQKGIEALADGNRPWASRAPLLIIGHTRKDDDCVLPGREYHQFDLGMSVMNLILAATALDLVARPMAGFDPSRAREHFGLAADQQPLVMLAVGKPGSDESHLPDHYKGLGQKPRQRRPAAETMQIL